MEKSPSKLLHIHATNTLQSWKSHLANCCIYMQACFVYEYGVWRTCIGHEITERVVNPCLDRTRLIWSLSCYIGVLRILRAREWKRKDREKRREKETLLNRKEYPPGGVFGGSVTFSLVDDTLLSTGRREGSTPWKTKRWRMQVGRGGAWRWER